MSRWVDRAALRLAGQTLSADAPPPSRESSWLLTRRESTRVVGAGAVAAGAALAFGPMTDPAQAASYCLNKCENAAYDHANSEFDAKRTKLVAALVGGVGSFAFEYIAVCAIMAGIETRLVSALSDCQGPNCGNASKYPNPIRTGPGGGGPPEPSPTPTCPPMTGICPGQNPPQCCLGSDVCCGCGVCCTFEQYCDPGCCSA